MKIFNSGSNYLPTDLKIGELVVWHIPQLPMKPFHVKADSWSEAESVMELLTVYDLFQFEFNVKGDYVNVSGVQIYGGHIYEQEYREGLDPSEYRDNDAFSDVESMDDYLEQLRYLQTKLEEQYLDVVGSGDGIN